MILPTFFAVAWGWCSGRLAQCRRWLFTTRHSVSSTSQFFLWTTARNGWTMFSAQWTRGSISSRKRLLRLRAKCILRLTLLLRLHPLRTPTCFSKTPFSYRSKRWLGRSATPPRSKHFGAATPARKSGCSVSSACFTWTMAGANTSPPGLVATLTTRSSRTAGFRCHALFPDGRV